MRIVALILVLATASSAAASEAFSPAQRQSADKAVVALRDEFDLRLIDYTSARFRDVRASAWRESDSVRICGLVNAKNRSGGYTGWTPFAYSGGSLFLDESDATKISQLCAESDARIQDGKDYSSDLTFKSP